MSDGRRYSDGIRIRIEPDVRKAIDEMAAREFLRPSEWVRRELRRVARQQPTDTGVERQSDHPRKAVA